MSYTFKIGQEVVCVRAGRITNNMKAEIPNLIIGKQYTVLGLHFCRDCGTQRIDVGIRRGSAHSLYCKCGGSEIIDNVWPVYSSRFVPLEEFKQSETALTELLNEIKIEI